MTQDVDFYYTLDGTDPSTIGIMADSVIIDHSCTLKVAAKLEHWADSPILSVPYEITGVVAQVTTDPATGMYTSQQTVRL